MKLKQVTVTALLLGLLVICASTARAVDGSFDIGASLTEDKPQSKLWYTVHPTTGAVTWWAILGDGTTGIWFYKLVVNGATSSFVKQTFPDGPDAGAGDDAQVDTVVSGRADVLWNDTHLFVLIYKGTTASLSKYTYNNADNPANQTYTRVTGFPITFTLLPTSETATIAQDSTGKLWLAYDPNTDIRVLWSTSADHTVWNTTGMSLGTINNNDDLDAIVAFHNCQGATLNNCIGVLWSDQATDSIRFRIHRDEDIETTWQNVEIAAQGGLIADDHVNVKVTHNGDILAAVKSGTTAPPPGSLDETNLFVRWHDTLPPTSPWTVYAGGRP